MKDERGMTPQWCRTLDGFMNLSVEDLTSKHVCASNVRTALANIGKQPLVDLMTKTEVKFKKSGNKDEMLATVAMNWQKILNWIDGLMGTHTIFTMDEPPVLTGGTGILFVVRQKALYPVFTNELKGYGFVEFKDLFSAILPDMVSKLVCEVSKKTLETMLKSVGMVARTSGAETWTTKDRMEALVVEHWDTIMTRSGYKPLHPRQELPSSSGYVPPAEAMPPHATTADPESSDDDASDALPFAVANPYTDNVEFVMLSPNDTLKEITQKLCQKFYNPDLSDAGVLIKVALPFGPPSRREARAVSVVAPQTSSGQQFVPFTGRPMKLGNGDIVELNEKKDGMKSVEIRMDVANAKLRFLYWYGGDSKFVHVFALLSNKGIDVRQARDSPQFIIKGSRSSAQNEDFVSAWAENSNGLDIVPHLAGGGKQSVRVKKEALKKDKIEKCQKLIDKSVATTTMDATVQSILDIPADDLITNAISYLNVDQLGMLLEIQAEEIEHGERIIKKVAPILVPLIGTLKDAIMKYGNGVVALENAVMKSFVQKYWDGKFNLALFFQEVSNQKVALTTRDAVLAQVGQGDTPMTG